MTISPDILAAQAAYAARPFAAYAYTSLSSGTNRFDTFNEAWADAIRILNAKSLNRHPCDRRAEITGPNGLKIRISPYALHHWI
jgi:hypothetical protein